MNSDKIIQLTTKLMELTSSEAIAWNVVDRQLLNEPNSGSIGEDEYFRMFPEKTASGNVVLGWSMRRIVWERFVYSSRVGDKVFRLNGIVYTTGKYGKIRLQLWNERETELEYEFPENASYVDLFHIVHSFSAGQVEEFVDQFLANSDLLAAH